ncbi:MAG TPA: hypothetical protein VKT72_18320, partial [Candidatus Baltobacteraceae bacterium]|nr:hypothetical protein [Candidatus Baltobacteraceae bacterium]
MQAGCLCACAHGSKSDSPATPPPPRTAAAVQGSLRPTMTLSGVVAPLQNVTISSTTQEPAD